MYSTLLTKVLPGEKQNKTKQNKTKQNKTKQNKNKTKQKTKTKTKQEKKKQNEFPLSLLSNVQQLSLQHSRIFEPHNVQKLPTKQVTFSTCPEFINMLGHYIQQRNDNWICE